MSTSKTADRILTTPRLTLRRATLDDVDPMFAIMSDPRAMRYWSTLPHDTPKTTAKIIRALAKRPAPATYLIIEHDEQVIGMGGMHGHNEVGYIIHADHWRKGFAREAMQAILPFLWEVTRRTYLFADVDPRNTASCGLLTALGFYETHRKERTYCVDGHWSDSVYFRLDRPADLR